MNISNLITQLVNKQSQITDPMDFALLGKAIEQLKVAKVFFVNYIEGLPTISTVPSGTLYYVRNEKSLFLSNSSVWLNLSHLNISNIYSFGSNTLGQLGISSVESQCCPSRMYSNISDWTDISAGAYHTTALRSNGTLWAWGSNSCGRLGDGTVVAKSSPVSVVGGFTDWCQVSSGECHTSAIRTNGTLWSWGDNGRGQLGHNTGSTCDRSSPVQVSGEFTDWCQVSSGVDHTSAVRTNGTLWAWGNAENGKLGDGTGGAACKSSPVSVLGGFTDWCQVSSGECHTAAVRTNGTLWTWGCANSGRLGDGTVIPKCSPVSVVGGFTDWCQVSAGTCHTAAVRTNGTLWTWGIGTNGMLGDGTTVAKCSPVSVIGGFTDWCDVSVNGNNSAAIRTNGTLWTWGWNNCGQLGDGTTVNKSSPVSVFGGHTDWCHISVGNLHIASLRNNT